MNKIINPCECEVYTTLGNKIFKNAFVRIEYKDSKLSFSGVVAPLSNGNCLGSAGQCIDEIRAGQPTDEWTPEMLNKLCNVWEKWHLNDMRPYCKHMEELGWTEHLQDRVKIEKWTLTNAAAKAKKDAEHRALECLKNGLPFYPTKDEIAYANMEYSIDVYNDEDALYRYGKLYRDAYELKEKDVLGHPNTEYKSRGWISYKDHELGFLGRPCPVCGYAYGSSWKFEEVPQDVIEWLENLPETKIQPAWA